MDLNPAWLGCATPGISSITPCSPCSSWVGQGCGTGCHRCHWEKGDREEAGIHPAGCTEPPPRAPPGTRNASAQPLIFWGDFQFLTSLFWVIYHFIPHRHFNFISDQWSHSKPIKCPEKSKDHSSRFPPHLLFPFFPSPSKRADLGTNLDVQRGQSPKTTSIFQAEMRIAVKSAVSWQGEGREGNYTAFWLGLRSNPSARSSGKEHGENGVAFQPLLAEAASGTFRPGFCSPALLNGLQLH